MSDQQRIEDIGFTWIAVLVVGYVLIQLAANLTAIKTVTLLGEHPIPAGTLLYALSFTWINLITEYLGKDRARRLVLVAIGANVLTIGWFQLVIGMHGTQEWYSNPANQSSLDTILGAVPRIYLASLTTAFIVENVDISVFQAVKVHAPKVPLWLRSGISNTVAAPLDGLLFATLAFAGTLPSSFIVSLVITSAVYKLVVSYLSIPFIYVLRGRRGDPAGSREGRSSASPAEVAPRGEPVGVSPTS